jgi:hypothetical protein
MSKFDPDNRVFGAGNSANTTSGSGAGFQEIQQGGNVSTRLPGRRTATGVPNQAGVPSATAGGVGGGGGAGDPAQMLLGKVMAKAAAGMGSGRGEVAQGLRGQLQGDVGRGFDSVVNKLSGGAEDVNERKPGQ